MSTLYLKAIFRLFVLSKSDIPCTTAAVDVGAKFAELLGEQRRLGSVLVQLCERISKRIASIVWKLSFFFFFFKTKTRRSYLDALPSEKVD